MQTSTDSHIQIKRRESVLIELRMVEEKPRFEIVEQIGHGQFSIVYKARWVNNPMKPKDPLTPSAYVALKRIKFYDIQNSKMRMDYVKEVKLLQQLKHPNIINYNISFIERNELFIVLELADGGDLSKLIRYFLKRRQLLSEHTILKYFTQICLAIKYIHSKRILHRDIKPANIFMTSDGCVKLGDFGLGRFFSQNTRDAHTIVGTFYYMSPERIRESGYGFSSDIWSLGCVLYELITLSSPFSILNVEQHIPNGNRIQQQDIRNQQQQQQRQTSPNTAHQQLNPPEATPPIHQNPQQSQYNLQWLINRIVRADYPSLESYTEISPRLRRLTTECLNPNPDSRPNMDYICSVVSGAYHEQHHPNQTTPGSRLSFQQERTQPLSCLVDNN